MAQSNYLYNKILEFMVGNREFTNSSDFYIALSTTDVSLGENISEPIGNGYARLHVANNPTNWSINTDGIVTNNIDLTFNESTAPWGTIKSIVVYDSAIDGNILYSTKLNPELIVQNTTVVSLPVGSVKFGKVTEA